jgi:hypothetical protein
MKIDYEWVVRWWCLQGQGSLLLQYGNAALMGT